MKSKEERYNTFLENNGFLGLISPQYRWKRIHVPSQFNFIRWFLVFKKCVFYKQIFFYLLLIRGETIWKSQQRQPSFFDCLCSLFPVATRNPQPIRTNLLRPTFTPHLPRMLKMKRGIIVPVPAKVTFDSTSPLITMWRIAKGSKSAPLVDIWKTKKKKSHGKSWRHPY